MFLLYFTKLKSKLTSCPFAILWWSQHVKKKVGYLASKLITEATQPTIECHEEFTWFFLVKRLDFFPLILTPVEFEIDPNFLRLNWHQIPGFLLSKNWNSNMASSFLLLLRPKQKWKKNAQQYFSSLKTLSSSCRLQLKVVDLLSRYYSSSQF